MRIVYTVPGLVPHGGIRVIFEHCNRLIDFGHEVFALFLQRGTPDWFVLDPRIHIIYNPRQASNVDVLVITSPHSINLAGKISAERTFLFCQMAEHLFNPDPYWQKLCRKFYTAPYPMLSISKWNIEMFENEFGRKHPTYYIGNGVNLDHFPIVDKPKDGKCVLVEGWTTSNPSKDTNRIGPKVALRLRDELGVKVLAYSQAPNTGPYYPDKFYLRPSLRQLNSLYSSASILIKASKYDARACAPMEAMTKGTPTVRAIIKGDDDLTDCVNCLRAPYDEEKLYINAKALLTDKHLLEMMRVKCLNYIQYCTWDYWMSEINNIYSCQG